MKISIVLSILLLGATALEAESEDALLKKLYEKAFSKKQNKTTVIKQDKIYLPLKVNGIQHTEVFATINNNKVYIKEEDIKYILSLIKKEYRKDFVYQTDKNGFVNIEFLNKDGIKVQYDEKFLILNVMIPPKLRAPTNIHLSYRRKKNTKGAVKPKAFSGAINIYLNQYYNNTNPEKTFKRQKLNGSSDLFFNLKDFVLESRIQYKEDAPKEFVRDKTRVVRDIEKYALRCIAGDSYLPKHNRQSFVDTLGFSVEKNYSILDNFGRNLRRMNSYEFFLENPSTVEIYVNGQYKRKLHLNAGTHNIHDLDLPAGLSDVRLKIIEDTGKIETLTFNDFQYGDLIRQGGIKYGAGYGVTYHKDDEGTIKYDWDDRIYSFYIDYGLTNSITFRGGYQAKKDYKSKALDIFFGTRFGLFDFFNVYSDNDFLDIYGKKYGVEYRTNIGKLNLSIFNEITQKDYTTISNYKISSSNRKKIKSNRIHLYYPMKNRLNLSFSASDYVKGDEKTRKYSAAITKTIFHNSYIKFGYEYEKNYETHIRNDKAYITFEYRFENNSNVKYSKYFKEDRQDVSINYRTGGYYNDSFTFEYEDSNNVDKFAFRNYIRDEKFRLNTSYDYYDKDGESDTKTLSLQLQTGLVFAGTNFTISEPMTSSFVIVENDDKLADNPVGIIGFQQEDDYIYKTYAIPLSNHRVKVLEADEVNLPLGVDLYEPIQKFVTHYKSGSVMKLDVKSLYSVKGKLVDQDG
ncbi:MAG: hypothetical protein GXO30_08385, partial [Epsilonproteobacteria bacterium]|nr:hypothetical protein [Campylobacterota bacterium]